MIIDFLNYQLIKSNNMKIHIPSDEWKCSFFEELILNPKNASFRKEMESSTHNCSKEQMETFIREAYANNFERLIKDSERHVLLIDLFQDESHLKADDDYEDKVS